MEIAITVLICSLCLGVFIYFAIKYYGETSKIDKEKKKENLKKKQEALKQEVVKSENNELPLSPIVLNAEQIMEDFKEKNPPKVLEEEQRNIAEKDENGENETLTEIKNLSNGVKAILFSDILKPKN